MFDMSNWGVGASTDVDTANSSEAPKAVAPNPVVEEKPMFTTKAGT